MTYNIFYNNNRARLFLSKSEGGYIASILYSTKRGRWSNGKEIIASFKVKSFYGVIQEETMERAKTWFICNIAKNFEIKPE